MEPSYIWWTTVLLTRLKAWCVNIPVGVYCPRWHWLGGAHWDTCFVIVMGYQMSVLFYMMVQLSFTEVKCSVSVAFLYPPAPYLALCSCDALLTLQIYTLVWLPDDNSWFSLNLSFLKQQKNHILIPLYIHQNMLNVIMDTGNPKALLSNGQSASAS